MQAVEMFFDLTAPASATEEQIDTPEDASQLEELKILQQSARECGLDQMSSNAADKIRMLTSTTRLKRLNMRELSIEERMDWCIWLPTAYSTLADTQRFNQFAWSDYAFDMIPIRVLDIIKVVRERKLFTELEIRTPEKAKVDPALFGKIGDTWYLLARWAESDEHLLPLEELPHATEMTLMQQNVMDVWTFTFFAVTAVIPSMFVDLFSTIPAETDNRFAYFPVVFYMILFLILTYYTIAGRVKLAYEKKAHPIAAAAVAARLKS